MTMITTLGFSVRAELAHHCQGQSPYIVLVGLFFLHFLRPKTDITLFFWFCKGPVNFSVSGTEKVSMKLETLDLIFPFLVFSYGILMIFVTENSFLDKLANERFPDMRATWRSHKSLSWVCLFVGGLWSLQNLWFGTH
jgi:hypothetical protein